MQVGLLNGIGWSAVVAVFTYLWFNDWRIGMVIAGAMVINLVLAAGAGFTIPLVLKKMNIDPALAELERRGYIRQRRMEQIGPGRPPSPNFEVNPAVIDPGNDRRRRQKCHNGVVAGEKSNSVDIGDSSGASEDASGDWGQV